jgi:hypothetical protein
VAGSGQEGRVRKGRMGREGGNGREGGDEEGN